MPDADEVFEAFNAWKTVKPVFDVSEPHDCRHQGRSVPAEREVTVVFRRYSQ